MTGGSGLGRSRVVPLYNLAFHALLPTTITDANTDQKVAKVSKKGQIDLEGFGVLEPRELVIGVNDLATIHRAALSSIGAAASSSTNAPAGSLSLLQVQQRGIQPTLPLHSPLLQPVNSRGTPDELGGRGPPRRQDTLDTQFSSASGASSSGHGHVNPRGGAMLSPSGSHSAGAGTSLSVTGVAPHPLAAGGALSPDSPPTSFSAMSPSAKAYDDGSNEHREPEKLGSKLLRGFKRLSLGPGSRLIPGGGSGSGGSPSSSPSMSHSKLGTSPPGASAGGAASIFSAAARKSIDAAAADAVSLVSRRTSIFSSAPPANSGAAAAVPTAAAHGANAAAPGTATDLGPASASESLPMQPIDRSKRGGKKRAEGYIWTVRKWTRKVAATELEGGVPPASSSSASGLGLFSAAASRRPAPIESSEPLDGRGPGQNEILTRVWRRFNLVNRLGGSEIHPDVQMIPVRFEWTRDTRKLHRRRATEEARAAAQAGILPSAEARRQSLAFGPGGAAPRSRPGSMILEHPSPGGGAGAAELNGSSATGSQQEDGRSRGLAASKSQVAPIDGEAEDDDEESDPEDSETPWSCHLVLGPQTKIPIGTLVPSPHHKRLFGQLAIPFPLPDLSTSGLGPDGAGLTREELKDIINVTALHLVVREGFGNLGGKKGK